MTDYEEAVAWGASNKFYSLGVVGYDKYNIGWNFPVETAKNNDLKGYIAMVIDYSSDELNAVRMMEDIIGMIVRVFLTR